MTFVKNITHEKAGYHIYNFNKSIDQYFIAGTYTLVDDGSTYEFLGVYNNGIGIGKYYSSYRFGSIGCYENHIEFYYPYGGSDFTCNLSVAVIIYSAKYSDLAVS